ncbi:MAG: hypothetical protein KC506_04130 [Nanoarchaeota archaeon]|nr:hypothetical protein [Nanoarchaeota archaeon]
MDDQKMNKRLEPSLKQDIENQLQLSFPSNCHPKPNENCSDSPLYVDFQPHKIINIE